MRIKVDELRPGMVVARDVRDRRGRLLLAAGNEVPAKALRIFRMWGVSDVEIAEPGAEPDQAAVPPPDPVRLAEATAVAEHLFRHTDVEHPVVAELMRLATIRIATRPKKAHAR